MDKLNELIDFHEMTEGDPELLVMLLELRRHRLDNWKQRTEELATECTRINREAQNLSNQLIDCDRLRLAAQAKLRELEAQLAELAKQKPVGTVSIVRDWNTHRNVATVNMRHDLVVSEMKDGDELFTHPAPAAVPVDLVPKTISIRQAIAALENHGFCTTPASGYKAGVNDTINEMLRRIEATSK